MQSVLPPPGSRIKIRIIHKKFHCQNNEKPVEKWDRRFFEQSESGRFLKSVGRESKKAAVSAAMYRTIKEVLILRPPVNGSEITEEN